MGYSFTCSDDVITAQLKRQTRGEIAAVGHCEAAMRDYLRNNKGDRYGKFRYPTDVIGVDIPESHAEFAPFRRRFGLEIEQRR